MFGVNFHDAFKIFGNDVSPLPKILHFVNLGFQFTCFIQMTVGHSGYEVGPYDMAIQTVGVLAHGYNNFTMMDTIDFKLYPISSNFH